MDIVGIDISKAKLDAGLIASFCRAHVPPAWVPAAAHLRELRELVRRCDALKAARVQDLNRQKSGFAASAVARSIAAHLDWLDGQIDAVMDEVCHRIASDPTLSKNLALVRQPGNVSRIGTEHLRSTLYVCALSAKRTNKPLAAAVIHTQKTFEPSPDARFPASPATRYLRRYSTGHAGRTLSSAAHAAQLEARAVQQQMRGRAITARSWHFQRPGPAAERHVVGDRQSEPEQVDDGAD